MKIFVPENWEKIKGEFQPHRVVEVRKGETEDACCAVVGKTLKMNVEPKNLKEVIEALADLGFDFAALIDFDLEIEGLERGFGFKIPKIRSAEEAAKAPEVESLKSLILKTKCAEGVEKCGAIGVFIGFVRHISDGKEVKQLEYEAYEDVFDEKIREIEEKLKGYPGIVNARIYHKRGIMMPGEDIVYVAVMGEHRKDIWGPLKESMELIKRELPVWKKEVFTDGEIWVHDKESDNYKN
jgi:molybdopterin synthase catalytic subunit